VLLTSFLVPKGDEEDLAELDDQQAGPAKKKKSFNRGPKLDSKRLYMFKTVTIMIVKVFGE